jgi:histone H3/H4
MAGDKIEVLFVKSKVKEHIKAQECNTAGDVLDGTKFNDIIKDILDKAIKRAKANNRKTVQGKDL